MLWPERAEKQSSHAAGILFCLSTGSLLLCVSPTVNNVCLVFLCLEAFAEGKIEEETEEKERKSSSCMYVSIVMGREKKRRKKRGRKEPTGWDHLCACLPACPCISYSPTTNMLPYICLYISL